MNPYQEGRRAHTEGKNVGGNPYPPEQYDFFRWETGFQVSFDEWQRNQLRRLLTSDDYKYHLARDRWLSDVSNGLDAMLLKLRN